ncbi:MAG: amidase [bacterium]
MKTIQEAAAALRARRVSSRELTLDALARIAARGQELSAFITVTDAGARLAAERADEELAAGRDRGPLHGIPVALKDLFDVAGIPTTAGSNVLAGNIPRTHSVVARRLIDAGAVIVGKTNMHEIAYGITSQNPHYGPVLNPYDPRRIAGGSSGGSAVAVGEGMAFAAMGTDTGGSIRIPASYCGVVGFKPTYDTVSRDGVVPLGFSLDHAGPMARTVRDCAAVLQVIAAGPALDVPGHGVSLAGLRVGVPEDYYFDRVQPEVAAAVRSAASVAKGLGAEVLGVRVPDIAAMNATARLILLVEASAAYEPWRGRREDFGDDVLALLDQGRLVAATDYVNAQRARRAQKREFARVWDRVDCLFTPTTPITAPLAGELLVDIEGELEDVRIASTRLVRAFNLLGLPALSMPCGFDSRGLPIGLQIVGPAREDARVLRVGAALEDALG